MKEYERRIAELEQLREKKEVEIALQINFFPKRHQDDVSQNGLETKNEEKVARAETTKDDYCLPAVLGARELARSTWYYRQNYVNAYTEKYAHLREPLEAIARENPAYGIGAPRKSLIRRHIITKPTTK